MSELSGEGEGTTITVGIKIKGWKKYKRALLRIRLARAELEVAKLRVQLGVKGAK